LNSDMQILVLFEYIMHAYCWYSFRMVMCRSYDSSSNSEGPKKESWVDKLGIHKTEKDSSGVGRLCLFRWLSQSLFLWRGRRIIMNALVRLGVTHLWCLFIPHFFCELERVNLAVLVMQVYIKPDMIVDYLWHFDR
jgi:hypothetical protein